MSLYTIKAGHHAVKFDDDFNVLSIYAVSEDGCSCPAGHLPTCRHREMLNLFKSTNKVGTGWFVDWDKSEWHEPLGVFGE